MDRGARRCGRSNSSRGKGSVSTVIAHTGRASFISAVETPELGLMLGLESGLGLGLESGSVLGSIIGLGLGPRPVPESELGPAPGPGLGLL